MVRRTWKCVPCGKTYGSRPGLIQPTCPSCGLNLSPIPQPALDLPTPKPRPMSGSRSGRHSAHSASRALSTAGGRRPADPAAAIALSSSSWVPDPDPGLSADTGLSVDSAPSPAPPLASFRMAGAAAGGLKIGVPDWLRSPWTWASIGGVVVAAAFTIVFLAVRPGPAPSQASAVPPATPHQPAGRPRDAAEYSANSAPVSASSAVSAASAQIATQGPRTINLLAMIDPARHTLGGNWRIENGALCSDHAHRAKVFIPYHPPAEYDFKIEFTRVGVDNCVAQMFTVNKHSAALILGGWNGTASGFQQISGKSANQNPTGNFALKWEVGRRHTAIVRVRRERIEAWLDGERIAAWDTDGGDLYNRDWPIEPQALGVGSEVSPTIFHVIEIVENPR